MTTNNSAAADRGIAGEGFAPFALFAGRVIPEDQAENREPSKGVRNDKDIKDRKDKEETSDDLDEALEETFPASDPVSVSNPTRPGAPKDHKN